MFPGVVGGGGWGVLSHIGYIVAPKGAFFAVLVINGVSLLVEIWSETGF